MRLNWNRYATDDEYRAAVEREWMEWISLFPEIALLSVEERERFKQFAKHLIEHLNH